MQISSFIAQLQRIASSHFLGVPDSQLKALCNYLYKNCGISPDHIIAANEGNCTALAAGYYLATGKVPVVYMQNSGLGNVVNPVASLLNDKVYGIPCVFVIGWRGEPGLKDEPQHIFQGAVTLDLLKVMDIASFVVRKDTTEQELAAQMAEFQLLLAAGKSVAFVIAKEALTYDEKVSFKNDFTMTREEVIRHITAFSGEDPIVSTTGKASRELFEIRVRNGQPHKYDFLTVGSMGHSSSIALGIALSKPHTKIWCIDGDGAALMHMGALAVIGSQRPRNLVHIVINNGAHESVGGLPTAARSASLAKVAEACGYVNVKTVGTFAELDAALKDARNADELTFIEAKTAIGARADLGRPTTSAMENRDGFMAYLKELR
ncbi:phosphonopyruvate decarboxylase [Pyramidobacter piscolens]|uniref:phosphonopyruvate decarboxylase n=1 Tax=Pyramidobacter piscolens TaxID=638849 RepID=UPI0026E043D6|nr:phosphonopyruvate decarboxylase [Pyramidobacter piscolens]